MKFKRQYLRSWSKKQCFLVLVLLAFVSSAQLKTTVDTTSIKIGEELLYSIEAEIDSTTVVVFPEGQTFKPMEMIESYAADTLRGNFKSKLIKKYGLTQFDSGAYTIPRQKILVGNKTIFSDSLRIIVQPVAVDTTKQKLYDIKPVIHVVNQRSFFDHYYWALILFLVCSGGVIYWLSYRKKTLSKEEKIAALPPYRRAKLALDKLDEQSYFEDQKVKEFYSELTFILRKYLNEKVYDQSLESTTEELIQRLSALRDANHVSINKETIKNIQATLQRADLVKFAKSKPDFEIARMDKHVIDKEIDHVRAALPEPSEEDLLKDLAYQKELKLKQKRKKIIVVGLSFVGILIAAFVGFSIVYGFNSVKDTVLRNPSKLLLETEDWVTSEYGAPGIIVETPKVLERQKKEKLYETTDSLNTKVFTYDNSKFPLEIIVKSSKKNSSDNAKNSSNEPLDLIKIADYELSLLEKKGAVNIIPRNEKFVSPNGQEGVKTYGTATLAFKSGRLTEGSFVILGFSTAAVLQQLIIVWKTDDPYSQQIVERILNSVELIKPNDS